MSAVRPQVVTIPGVFVEVLGEGVLITGPSGVGKSELALELISRGGRLIVDDAPEFQLAGGIGVEGTCPEGLGEFLAHRDLGLLNIRALFGAGAVKGRGRLGLIVELRRPGASGPPDEGPCLELAWEAREVLGVPVPAARLWVGAGRSLAVIVETLVRGHRLRERGYDAYADFVRRQEALMEALREERG
jgi:HPr kinase/phosphorylase